MIFTSDTKVKNVNWPDIYFTPEYGKIMETSERIWECFLYKDIIYVYYKKSIELDEEVYWDLSSPYGYSGLYIPKNTKKYTIETFLSLFVEKCKENNYITEFIQFNPYLDISLEGLQEMYKIEKSKEVFSIEVNNLEEFKNKSRKNRQTINKGLKTLDFDILELQKEEKLVQFRHLYNKTMQRLNAKEFYLFNDKYFSELCNMKGVYLINIETRDKTLVMSALFFVYKDRCHYHLSCRNPDKKIYWAGNFMFYKLYEWCLQRGIKYIHLGGGIKRGDSLESFKRRLSTNSHAYYYSKRILNNEIYTKLVEEYSKEETNYFPPYRNES